MPGEEKIRQGPGSLNRILVFVIASGAVLALTVEEKKKREKSIVDTKRVQVGGSILAGIAGFAIIYYNCRALIFLLSMLASGEE